MKKSSGRGQAALATKTVMSTAQKVFIASAMFLGAASIAAAGFAGTPEKVPQKKYFNGSGAAEKASAGGKYDYILAPKVNHVYHLGSKEGGLYYFAKNNKFYQVVGYYDAWKSTVVYNGAIVTDKQFETAKGEAGFVRPRPGSTLISFKNTPKFPDLYVSEAGGVLRKVNSEWAKQYFGANWAANITVIDNFEYGKTGSMWVDFFGFKLGIPADTMTTGTPKYVPSQVMSKTTSISKDLGL